MNRTARRLVSLGSAAGVLYVGGSFLASRALARRLLSPAGLGPTPNRYGDLTASLQRTAAVFADFRHAGSARLPVELSAIFASPGEPASRPTILFLHGKGGNASEWTPDALRALRLGYNVLIPDLRGHGRSGGLFFTLGYLEKEDLALTLEAAVERFGVDPGRLGIHSCSAGSSVALEFAAGRAGIRAIWLESPFAQAREMAPHYLSRATGIPRPLLALASRWAIARAVARVGRELGVHDPAGGLALLDPLRAVARTTAAILLVHGEDDGLVPPRFTGRLAAALPPRSALWRVPGAGHCHHGNEPAAVALEAYARRWGEFFRTYLPA
ncbi:MAG: alpha/beta hydrolase [Acidobacteriota bacterium]